MLSLIMIQTRQNQLSIPLKYKRTTNTTAKLVVKLIHLRICKLLLPEVEALQKWKSITVFNSENEP